MRFLGHSIFAIFSKLPVFGRVSGAAWLRREAVYSGTLVEGSRLYIRCAAGRSRHALEETKVLKTPLRFALVVAGVVVLGGLKWSSLALADYESAPYTVVETDGNIEVREYPDLVVASTTAPFEARGNDGSFMRLFRYISGDNTASQKIAMTTPVFMAAGESETMEFVMPQEVATAGAPDPSSDEVSIRTRQGGRFAVIRFSGVMDVKKADAQEQQLRTWIESRGLEAEGSSERAGYNAPFTPGFLRRNEVLIRIMPVASAEATPEAGAE